MPHPASRSSRMTTAGSSTGSKTPSSRPAAASASGADTEPIRWLEIAVPAHAEAVEAVSEILGRVGYNGVAIEEPVNGDRKSTRLNSSHEWISYAVFCLKKKKHQIVY